MDLQKVVEELGVVISATDKLERKIQAAVWREAAGVAGRKAAALQAQGARMDQWAPVRGVEITCEARAEALEKEAP